MRAILYTAISECPFKFIAEMRKFRVINGVDFPYQRISLFAAREDRR